jgi:uncharacterized protein
MYPRLIERRIRQALRDTPVVSISGPRQSGKTTLVRRLATPTRRYVTLDSATQRNAAIADPESFIADANQLIIDEVQRAPGLLVAIKKSVDEDRRPGRFVLTGSANLAGLADRESLAGRIETIPLYPLARAEISRLRSTRFLDAAFSGAAFVTAGSRAAEDLLKVIVDGGYPAALQRKTDARRRAWYTAYIQALVREDVPDVSPLEKPARLPRLLQHAARLSGQLLNLASLGRDVGLDRKTVDHYLQVLERLYVLHRLPPWHRNELSRLVKTPKLHFVDSGLLAAMLRQSPARLRQERSGLGPLVECHVLAELLKQATWWDDELAISYYRDKDQCEVDFVLENAAADIVGIEVKAAASVQSADFSGLVRLQRASGKTFVQGIVLYGGSAAVNFGPRLRAVPLACLWS